jgi:two-component system sensor histidine kinase VicK
MTRSIKWRMVSIFVLLVVIVMIISGMLIVYQTKKYEYNIIREELVATANSVYASVIIDLPSSEIEGHIIEMIEEQSVLLKGKVYLLDEKGGIIYTQEVSTEEQRFNTAQVMAAITQSEIEELDEVHLSGNSATYLGYARPIIKNNNVIYVIYVLASTVQVQEKVSAITSVIAIAVLLAIVLSILLAFLFSAFLTKPIIALTKKAREMSKGELKNPIEVFSNDEIGELTTNFNRMAFSLNETLAQIASEKNKMETVITHMTDGILVFDNFGILIHYNPASIRMLKIKNALSFNDIFGTKLKISFEKVLGDVEKKQRKITVTLDEAYYSIDFAKYIDKNGIIQGLICVIQDITEHKKLENMQKEFVANVSHELRTPLTTIKSYAETLLEGALEDIEVAERFLGVINKESDRMTSLVQDLLELSKLDNQKTSFDRSEINLAEIVRTIARNYEIHAKKKNQHLECQIIEENALILGDANRIEQVIKNILSNAVKYSPEYADVQVRLINDGVYYVLEIRDTGMGIPKEDLEHIFDRFYRVDKARSRAMGGTGLGLAIAKEIMELHKGWIKVESEVEKGTCFYLYFLMHKKENDIE